MRTQRGTRNGARGLWGRVRYAMLRLLHLRDSPHSIAWGMAWGFFVGMTPTMGAQMYIAGLTAPIVRANIFSSIAAVWITNPWTFIPIYFFNYRVGAWIMRLDPLSFHDLRGIFGTIWHYSIWSPRVAWNEGFLKLGNHFWPLLLGCVVVGVAGMPVAYSATYAAVVYYRRRRELRRLHRQRRQRQEGER